MATAPKTDAEKVAKLREMAKDKSLPQDVRNTYLDQAVKLEEKGAMKAGVKMAKGGAMAKDLPMRGQRTATNMAKGGAVKAKKGGK
jgi:ribosomal protein S13